LTWKWRVCLRKSHDVMLNSKSLEMIVLWRWLIWWSPVIFCCQRTSLLQIETWHF